jgi:hypothetical protein
MLSEIDAYSIARPARPLCIAERGGAISRDGYRCRRAVHEAQTGAVYPSFR